MTEMAARTLALEAVATLVDSAPPTANPRRRLQLRRPTFSSWMPSNHATNTNDANGWAMRDAIADVAIFVPEGGGGGAAAAPSRCVDQPAVGVRVPTILPVALHAELAGDRSTPAHHNQPRSRYFYVFIHSLVCRLCVRSTANEDRASGCLRRGRRMDAKQK